MDVKIIDEWWDIDSLYSVNRNFDTILLGTGNIKALEDRMLDNRSDLRSWLRPFTSLEKTAEDKTGDSLTHETLHIVLYNVAGFDASQGLDNIDTKHEITEYHSFE